MHELRKNFPDFRIGVNINLTSVHCLADYPLDFEGQLQVAEFARHAQARRLIDKRASRRKENVRFRLAQGRSKVHIHARLLAVDFLSPQQEAELTVLVDCVNEERASLDAGLLQLFGKIKDVDWFSGCELLALVELTAVLGVVVLRMVFF